MPGLPKIVLHLADMKSHIRSLLYEVGSDLSPYWAYAWGGGICLARHILENPKLVRDRRVMDLGAGSGLAGIAAAIAGAKSVTAVEIDPVGQVAVGLNFELNGLARPDVLDNVPWAELAQFDLVLAGDVFYDASVAAASIAMLDRIALIGTQILVGDPGRKYLPLEKLAQVANYPVADFGESRVSSAGTVYGLALAIDTMHRGLSNS